MAIFYIMVKINLAKHNLFLGAQEVWKPPSKGLKCHCMPT